MDMKRRIAIAVLKAQRKELRQEIKDLLNGIRIIDASIALIERRPSSLATRAKWRERQTFIFQYIRERGIATSAEVARAWIARNPRALSPETKVRIVGKVRAVFREYERKGYLTHCGFQGTAKLWKLADCHPSSQMR